MCDEVHMTKYSEALELNYYCGSRKKAKRALFDV